jgi:hypothetical protein
VDLYLLKDHILSHELAQDLVGTLGLVLLSVFPVLSLSGALAVLRVVSLLLLFLLVLLSSVVAGGLSVFIVTIVAVVTVVAVVASPLGQDLVGRSFFLFFLASVIMDTGRFSVALVVRIVIVTLVLRYLSVVSSLEGLGLDLRLVLVILLSAALVAVFTVLAVGTALSVSTVVFVALSSLGKDLVLLGLFIIRVVIAVLAGVAIAVDGAVSVLADDLLSVDSLAICF